ncbi:MAG: TIGR00282 family metallophosphoesterase [Bdellovibrionota bacterium]
MILKIGFLGDIVGKSGRNFVKTSIESIKKEYSLDVLIANAENASGGTGLGAKEALELHLAGIDLISLGDHSFSNNTLLSFINSRDNTFCITPCNYEDNKAKKEYIVYNFNGVNIVLFSMLGAVFIQEKIENPFLKVDKVLEDINKNVPNNIIILDFHAEATSEKMAMGYFVDSKISAFFGTHTHVQTNDAKILQGGIGYITDVGMCGPRNGVIGMDISYSLERLTGKRKKGYKLARGESKINGVVVLIDTKTKKTKEIKSFKLFE